jgi:hypothetical protein
MTLMGLVTERLPLGLAVLAVVPSAILLAAPGHADADTAYVRSPWGYRCLLTDYESTIGAPQAVCEIPKADNDDASLNALTGALKWSTGNIGGMGDDWSETDIHVVSGQSYDVANGWGLTVTDAGLKIRWDFTGHSMVLHPDGTVTAGG